jgi:hypothetical protein
MVSRRSIRASQKRKSKRGSKKMAKRVSQKRSLIKRRNMKGGDDNKISEILYLIIKKKNLTDLYNSDNINIKDKQIIGDKIDILNGLIQQKINETRNSFKYI